jgi:hypothetical protein
MTILAGFLSAAERQHLLAMARDPARISMAPRCRWRPATRSSSAPTSSATP